MKLIKTVLCIILVSCSLFLSLKLLEYKKYYDYVIENNNNKTTELIEKIISNKENFDNMDFVSISSNQIWELCTNSEIIVSNCIEMNNISLETNQLQLGIPLLLDCQSDLYNTLWMSYINNYHQIDRLDLKPISFNRSNRPFKTNEKEYFEVQKYVNYICYEYFVSNIIDNKYFDEKGEIRLVEDISPKKWLEINEVIDRKLLTYYEEHFKLQSTIKLFRLRENISIDEIE